MRAIEAAILAAPEAHPISRGSRASGRRASPAPASASAEGVIYFMAFKGRLLAMLTAYVKNDKDDLTSEDRRAILRGIEREPEAVRRALAS